MFDFESVINYDRLNSLSLGELRAVKKALSFVPNNQKLYDCDYIAHLISQYSEKGGEVITIDEGLPWLWLYDYVWRGSENHNRKRGLYQRVVVRSYRPNV